MGDYGKRGGTSKNAGKKASTYEATLPGGRVVRKRSFEFDTQEALLAYYGSDDDLRANCICTAEWAERWGYRTVPAKKVS